jgi:hypothetical protein
VRKIRVKKSRESLAGVTFICGPQHDNRIPVPPTSVPEAAKTLQEMLDIQCSTGNWDYDPYMHGMANGMIFALSILTDENPVYLNAPSAWGKDKPNLDIPTAEATATDIPPINRYQSILNRYYVLSAEEKQVVDTMAKAYSVFKRIGITGFKTPKMSGGKGEQVVKVATITTKGNKYFHIRLYSQGKDGIKYQCTKPGSENYSCDKVTKATTDIKKFLIQLSKVKGLSEYKEKIEEYLNE